jgi:3-phenylpropionate/trans-cinnamate dioxygenase ferredoxin subunit
MSLWISACKTDDLADETVIRFDHGDKTFAIYRKDDAFFATDGLCTHEAVHLAGGFVMEHTIECPKHGGTFDYRTGAATGAPVCIHLKTYTTKIDNGHVLIELP